MKITIDDYTYKDNKKHKCGLPNCQAKAKYKVVTDEMFTKIIYKVCKKHCYGFTKWKKQFDESFEHSMENIWED